MPLTENKIMLNAKARHILLEEKPVQFIKNFGILSAFNIERNITEKEPTVIKV
jgi:hypothetical protein